jgi:hypothetical protein
MTNLVPGKLWTYFLNAIIITIPTSLVVLAGYRHAVSRAMRLGGNPESGLSAANVLKTVQNSAREAAHVADEAAVRRRLGLIYAAGSVVAAAIMAWLLAWSMKFDISARGYFASWYVFAWPLLPILVVLVAWPQRRNIPLLLAYAAAGAALIGCWTFMSAYLFGDATVSPLKSAAGVLELFVRQIWLPYTIILLTGNRRLRPVSPLVLAGLLTFSFGTLFTRDAYVAAVQANPGAPWLLFPGSNSYSLWYFIAALPIGYACWLGIRAVARGYDRKHFSDIQLLVDSWWVIVAFQFSTDLANDFGWGGVVGLLAFVGYRVVVETWLRLFRLSARGAGPTLLLLRVFDFQRRTERLFDAVAERWRFKGPVLMIAGPDLAMRTLNPGEIISYLSGRLKSQFIAEPAQIEQAVGVIDQGADPDGRFRITKVFCRDNAWRAALTKLLDHSDTVIMDLRGFSATNQGCMFELEQLAVHGLLSRTLFVVDSATDVPLLEATVVNQADAPGHGSIRHRFFHLGKQSSGALREVYDRLHASVGA